MEQHQLTKDYSSNITTLNQKLKIEQSFDLIGRKLKIANKKACLYFVDGFAKDEVLEKVLEFLMSIEEKQLTEIHTANDFSDTFMSYIETEVNQNYDDIITAVLSGTVALIIEGFSEALLIDARTYPARGVEEPEDDKVLRGSHDGFVETLIFNTALIRRRMRVPELTMDIMQAGTSSKTDIVICYMSNLVDKKLLKLIKDKINKIDVKTLTLSQESLAECLVKPQWYNPFPRVRYTERPDTATANIAEGKIVIIIDNSPSVMILPTRFFDFLQEANDFYFPPIIGTYLRLVRIIVFTLTIFLTPIWYLLIQNPQYIPSWLDFIKVAEPNSVPIIFQLLIIELVIDGLKLASLNTPSVLSNSFSVVGALILGDFAIKARWFVPEVILYMAFVAIANYTQPSFELGYAFKFWRMILLILTALFNVWGFGIGIIGMFILIATTKTISGKSYLHPLIPFKPKEFVALFIRHPINRKNT